MKNKMMDVVSMLEQGDWQQAHANVQDDHSAIGCWLHGIVHLMEGDLSNARYWYTRAQRHFANDLSVAEELAEVRRALTL